jgi:pimeloyl-ACP methyl ester carboxylesterase
MSLATLAKSRYGQRMWLKIALALIGVYAGVIVFGHIGDRLILWPTTAPLDAHGAERVIVPLADGTIDVFRAAMSRKPTRFVLRFYGNSDRAEHWVAGEAAGWGDTEFWGVNYPGYGGSTGPARLQRVADAALVAYDALARVAGDRPIFVFGTSLGTAAALHVAAERKVAGLVLQNPPALAQLVRGEHGWWNLWLLAYPVSLQIPRDLDSVANAGRVQAPAIFLLADHDEIVPPRYHHLVADAYAGPKEILVQPGAGHNTPMSEAFAQVVHEAEVRLMKNVN